MHNLQYARSVLFWLGFMLSTIIVTSILSISFLLPFRIRYQISKLWPLFNLWWLKLTCHLDYEVVGLENVPDESVVFMSKHQSTWETLAYQLFMPPMVWVLKRELLWIPIFGWGCSMLKPIAINRSQGKKALRQLIEQGGARLRDGISVMIFPEGTRTSYGSETRYLPGGAMLASKTGHAVVPIAHNAGYFWPKHTMRKRPGKITVVIGKPIESRGKSASQILDESRHWIENELTRIDPETRDG